MRFAQDFPISRVAISRLSRHVRVVCSLPIETKLQQYPSLIVHFEFFFRISGNLLSSFVENGFDFMLNFALFEDLSPILSLLNQTLFILQSCYLYSLVCCYEPHPFVVISWEHAMFLIQIHSASPLPIFKRDVFVHAVRFDSRMFSKCVDVAPHARRVLFQVDCSPYI